MRLTCCIVPLNISFSILSLPTNAAGATTVVTVGAGGPTLPSLSFGGIAYTGGGMDAMWRNRVCSAMNRLAGGTGW